MNANAIVIGHIDPATLKLRMEHDAKVRELRRKLKANRKASPTPSIYQPKRKAK